MGIFDKRRQELNISTSPNDYTASNISNSRFAKRRLEFSKTLSKNDADSEKKRARVTTEEASQIGSDNKDIKPKSNFKVSSLFTPQVGTAIKAVKGYIGRTDEEKKRDLEEFAKSKEGAFGLALADSVTLGLNTKLLQAVTGDKKGVDDLYKKAKEANPKPYMAGEFAGYVVPGELAVKVTKPLVKAATKKVVSKVAKKGIEGAIVGGAFGVGQGIGHVDSDKSINENIKDVGKSTLENAAFGAAGDVALYGAGKGIKAIVNKLKAKKALTEAEKEIVKGTPELQELPEAKEIIKPETPKTKVSKDKYIAMYKEKLPKTEEGLQKHIDSLTKRKNELQVKLDELKANNAGDQEIKKVEKEMMKINLQMFAGEEVKKVSRFKTNTLKKSPLLQDEKMQEVVDSIEADYAVKPDKETLENAAESVEMDMEWEMKKIKGREALNSAEDAASAWLITKKLRQEAEQTGDYSKVAKWLQVVQPKVTSTAQTLHAIGLWKRTSPEGVLMKAQRVVKQVEDKLKETNPNKLKQVENETDMLQDAIDKVDSDTADQLADEIAQNAGEVLNKVKAGNKPGTSENIEAKPDEMLSKRIADYLKDPKVKEDDPVKDMVNELFRIAKESPLNRKKVKSKSAIEFLSDAIKNRDEYVDTWKKAKDIVKEKFKDNPDALSKLEKYFDKGIKPSFSEQSFNSSMNEGMKALNINVGELVRNYFKTGSKSRQDLVDYIVSKAGLEGQEANVLAKYIQNRMHELTKVKKEEILKGMFKVKPKAEKGSVLKSVEELSNLGVFVNDNYKTAALEKLTPKLKQLLQESDIDIGSLVKKSVEDVDFTRTKFLNELSDKLNVNDRDAYTILKEVEERFNVIADEKKSSILNQMFKKRIPGPKKSMYEKVQELINLGAFDRDSLKELIKEKHGLPSLNNDDVKFISDRMKQIDSLDSESYEYRRLMSEIQKRIEDKLPTTIIDQFRGIQRLSMIFNPKTLITRNPGGNFLIGRVEDLRENTLGAFVDMITSKIRGSERTTISDFVGKNVAEAKGAAKGLEEWVKDIKYNVDTSPTGGQMELKKGKTWGKGNRVTKHINPVLNTLDDIEKRVLQLGDRPFYEGAKARRLHELKKIKNTDAVTDEMKVDAIAYALDRTFQNDSELSKIFSNAKHASDKVSFQLLANAVLPFTKTPANILDKMIDYSPIGLAKAVLHAGTTKGKGTFNQKLFTDTLSRAMTGTGIATLGFVLASKGIITGEPNKNKNVSNYEKAIGKGTYSFKLPGGYFSYDWAQPVGSLLAIGADAFNGGVEKKDFLTALAGGAESGANTFFNMSMLKNINDLMSGYSPAAGFVKSLLGSTTQFTPTVGKQISQLVDPYVRETYDPNILKEQLNKIKARIPGISMTLPVKQDVFGKDIEAFQGDNNVWNVLFNPGVTTKYNPDEVQKELLRLYDITSDEGLMPTVADKSLSRTVNKNKEIIRLTPEEYTSYQKRMGEIMLNGLKDKNGRIIMMGIAELIKTDHYKKQLSDAGKAKRIKSIVGKSKEIADKEVWERQ